MSFAFQRISAWSPLPCTSSALGRELGMHRLSWYGLLGCCGFQLRSSGGTYLYWLLYSESVYKNSFCPHRVSHKSCRLYMVRSLLLCLEQQILVMYRLSQRIVVFCCYSHYFHLWHRLEKLGEGNHFWMTQLRHTGQLPALWASLWVPRRWGQEWDNIHSSHLPKECLETFVETRVCALESVK